jgi:hypothetical protein
MGQKDGRLSCCFVLPVIDPCLSFIGDFLLLVVVALRGFNFGGSVPPFFLYFVLEFC